MQEGQCRALKVVPKVVLYIPKVNHTNTHCDTPERERRKKEKGRERERESASEVYRTAEKSFDLGGWGKAGRDGKNEFAILMVSGMCNNSSLDPNTPLKDTTHPVHDPLPKHMAPFSSANFYSTAKSSSHEGCKEPYKR